MTKRRRKTFDFAPSACHERVIKLTKQALAYDGGEVKAWQARLRRKLRDLLGWSRMPSLRGPLHVRSVWRRPHRLGTIEKIVFTAEPGADVPAYVCLPKAEPPYTFMICLQGHSTGMHNSIAVDRHDDTKRIRVAGDRDFAFGCMARGVAALCIEQRSFGERGETVQEQVSGYNMCHDAVVRAHMLGRTLIGERVFDVDRGIDYLASRGDVDMRRLGCMGNSGGGTVTMYAAAILRRIRFAMPSCSFCGYRDSIMSIYHCGCNHIPHLYEWAEMADVVGLFAPRPVVVVAGRDDGIFPLRGVRSAFRDLKRIYRASGAADRCRLVVGGEGHRFYADLAWPKALAELSRLA